MSAVEEDGDEVFIPIKDVRCCGVRLEKRKHDNNESMHWRCQVCGGYYGEAE